MLRTLLSLFALSVPAAAGRLIEHPGTAVEGEYIVVLHGTPSPAARVETHRAIDVIASRHGAAAMRRYDAALRGFVARLTPAQAAQLAADPDVAFVEQNQVVQLAEVQSMPTWGLDRIDQPALPLDNKFAALGDGAGVTVFVIDTGIRSTHGEFTGRIGAGFTALQDGRGTEDCNGHGSHVAGTAAGTAYGVAKRAKLVPVRVIGCEGTGSTADVIAGIDWVRTNKQPLSVVNMSIGAPANTAEDQAVQNLIAAGVTVVVAAGNENQDACLKSPARVPAAITVGATSRTDARASFSNFGTCVDVSAPGVGIVSAGIAGDTATNTLNGTSMASPHVAGIAAAYLAENITATPAQVAAAIVGGAIKDKITDPKGSPNLLATSRIVDTIAPAATIVSPAAGAKVAPSFTVTVDADDANLGGVSLRVDGAVAGERTEGPFTFEVTDLAPGTHTLTVVASDLAGLSTMREVSVTVDPEMADPGEPGAEEVTGGCSSSGGSGGLLLALGALLARRGRRLR